MRAQERGFGGSYLCTYVTMGEISSASCERSVRANHAVYRPQEG